MKQKRVYVNGRLLAFQANDRGSNPLTRSKNVNHNNLGKGKFMNKNKQLYNASMVLVQAATFVKSVEPKYAQELLSKAQEYSDRIVIDEDVEKEVNEFEQKIKEGL